MVSALDALFSNFYNINQPLLSFCYPSIKSLVDFVLFFSTNCEKVSLHCFFDQMCERLQNRFGVSCADRSVAALMKRQYTTFSDRCKAMNLYVLQINDRVSALDATYSNFYNTNKPILSFCHPSIKTLADFIHFFSTRCENISLHCFFDQMCAGLLSRTGDSCADRNLLALMETQYGSFTDRCKAINFYVLQDCNLNFRGAGLAGLERDERIFLAMTADIPMGTKVFAPADWL